MEDRFCKECGKKLTSYNHGKYCFACNARCVIRDDELLDEAERCISRSVAQIKFLKNEKCVAREILRLKKVIKEQNNLIKMVNS